ncbi:MAG: two-component regulator propeller domain-containing protein [Steroidobacteraceae bacterium]
MNAQALASAWRATLNTLLGWMLTASVATAMDASPLVLEHLTISDGLPQATVMTTLQDSQGFVWLGTEDGLVRYDGHELRRYAYSRNERNALPGNYIWHIVEDANQDLWIAISDRGVARWNRRTDTFTVYSHDPKNANSLSSDSVRALLVDPRGRVWIGTTDAGVDILDPKSGRIEHLRHDPAQRDSLSSDQVSTLSLARSGGVWIGTKAGLDLAALDQRAVVRFEPRSKAVDSVGSLEVSQILEDQSGAVWVGSFNGGLIRLDREGRLLNVFRHAADHSDSIANDDVRAVLEDRAGRLWIGTADGLDLLDRSTGRFTHFRRDENNTDSLRDSFIMSLYEDPAGLLWVGTRTGGVSRWNPHSWQFGGHRPTWVGSGSVTAFADAPEGRVWIASLDGGLVQFDSTTGESRTLDAVLRRRTALSDARVMSLREDHLGSLWIGTMLDGLKRLTPDGRIETIPVAEGNPRATSAPGIMTIFETRAGSIWIGTFGGGANVLDPATGMIRQLPYGSGVPGAISGANVTAIAEDTRGNLWVGTQGAGLNLVRADGTVLMSFKHEPNNLASFPANSIYAITIDAEERVWIATEGGGLVRVVGSASAPQAIRFQVMTRAEGLSSDTLYGVIPDGTGNLWLSGNAGLMRFSPARQTVKTYHREHGLQGEEFTFGAHHRLRDGRVCFGGAGGFNIFNPAQLTEERDSPRLALTNIEVLGVRLPTTTPAWLLERVPLDYRASIVSLDFGVLDFRSTRHNRLSYRMPGLTEEWIDLGSERRVTLTNLSAGDHVLEVRAAGPDSDWSTTPLQVTIHREPAPWRSPAAYAIYAALVLALIVYRVHRQRRKLRAIVEAKERLESEVQLRTRELVESNRQLAEAAQAKSDFLDRMSHELRTPMNGVVGMTELLSRTVLSATQAHLTKTIRSSAQILLQIVNDLLDLSKIRAGKVTLEALPIDLGQVLEECTSLFAGAAESKGIELIVCPPERNEDVLLGDPLRVRQILMNLVGNAVKFTTKGEVVVRADVSVVADGATALIAISDTGVGMDANAIARIFEPFSQADETTTRRFGGTGLGLSICRELADLMGAKITVESQPQVGSTFSLELPLKVDTYKAASDPLPLPSATPVRILTRRPSLQESLSRHASLLGLTPAPRGNLPAGAEPDDMVTVLDVSTHLEDLKSMLVAPKSAWQKLIIVATAAEVEAHDLRVLIEERRIVLKPVHRIAIREALAAAFGIEALDPVGSGDVPTPSARFSGHVLLVEDEPVNATVAEGYLAALGCTSVWVTTAADAAARSAAERFDLVLMDLNMPDMDGFAATKLIRQHHYRRTRVPIVALTAHEASSYRDKCLQADMDDILSKPYVLEDCARMLSKWLARRNDTLVSDTSTTPVSMVDTLTSIDAKVISELRKLRAGKQTNLYSKLVGLFRNGSSESMAQLSAAMNAHDLKSAASICHKLASSAANVGALAYAKQVRRLEELCNAGDIENGRSLHDQLQAAHLPLIDALCSFSLQATA